MKNVSRPEAVPFAEPSDTLLERLCEDLQMLLAPCPEIHPYDSSLPELPVDWVDDDAGNGPH
jgi:hypothetical protein